MNTPTWPGGLFTNVGCVRADLIGANGGRRAPRFGGGVPRHLTAVTTCPDRDVAPHPVVEG